MVSERPLLLQPAGTRPDDALLLLSRLEEVIAPSGSRRARAVLVPASPQEDHAALRRALAGAGPIPQAADLIVRTSGSTSGSGRLIAMSSEALVACARAAHERLGGPGTWVLALPAHHVAGVQVLIRSLLAGTRPAVVDTGAGFQPAALARALEGALSGAASGPVYTSLVPTQLLRCLDDARATAALAGLSRVLVGGAAPPAGLMERARRAGVRPVVTYGMSETGGGCVYDGWPLAGVGVGIDEPDADGVGRVVLTGPVLAEGYLGGAGRGAGAFFRPGPPRRLVTTDRGRLRAGRLEVLGRVDEVIVTGGVKVEPGPVEEALAGFDDVAQACVVGLPDPVWGAAVVAVVVARAGAVLRPEELRRRARRVLDGAHAPKHVLVVGHLPLRGVGKVDRRAVEALAARDLGRV